MKNLIEKAILEFNMFSPDDRMVVGLSGGADSVALTHYLRFFKGVSLTCCHLNHCLRGEESERDMAFVRDLCNKWEIPLFVKSLDIASLAKDRGMTLEEAGRTARYEFFEEIREKQKADKIATAHTLTDSIETVLLALSRGTGLRGLCGIPPVRGRIVRPFIYITRADVEGYCNEHTLSYVTDSTNLEDTYSRNRVRHIVFPALNEINPSFERTAGRTIDLLRAEEEYLEQETEALRRRVCLETGYDCKLLLSAPRALRSRLLYSLLQNYRVSRTAAKVERLETMLSGVYAREELSADCIAEVRNGVLHFFVPEPDCPSFCYVIHPGKTLLHEGEKYSIRLCDRQTYLLTKKVYKNLLYLALDYDRIIGKLVFRQKKPGDYISLSHRDGGKTVKKLLNEEKLTSYQKSALPVVADDRGVCAVWGLGVDKRLAVGENTQTVLLLLKEEGNMGRNIWP